jgi:hypothetical protein
MRAVSGLSRGTDAIDEALTVSPAFAGAVSQR